MKHFLDIYREKFSAQSLPWLVLGKGPTFARKDEFDLQAFNSIALNHVVNDVAVTFAHLIDIDVVEHCASHLESNTQYVIMPWIPHVHCHPGSADLAGWVEQIPVLGRLAAQDRLLWYDLNTAKCRQGAEPVVEAGYFSAESVLHLLSLAGAKVIRTLGVDGVSEYSDEFSAIEATTKFANGQQSFDRQFERFAELRREFKLDLAPLTVQSPIRVYVGCSRSEWLPFKVLEHSINRHARMPVECFPLYDAQIPIPSPRESCNRPRTNFSFQRFLIPEIACFKGRAIYLDSDMVVLKDIAELWTLPFNSAQILGIDAFSPAHEASKFSVMLLDCDQLDWKIKNIVASLDRGTIDYKSLMHDLSMAKVRLSIPAIWNSIDMVIPGQTALIHYTDLNQQPWLTRSGTGHQHWIPLLREAVISGHVDMVAIADEVERGHVRPSLLAQLELGIDDPVDLPIDAVLADADFVPPHLQRPGPLKNLIQNLFGKARL